jgi:hypothetical protein
VKKISITEFEFPSPDDSTRTIDVWFDGEGINIDGHLITWADIDAARKDSTQ